MASIATGGFKHPVGHHHGLCQSFLQAGSTLFVGAMAAVQHWTCPLPGERARLI